MVSLALSDFEGFNPEWVIDRDVKIREILLFKSKVDVDFAKVVRTPERAGIFTQDMMKAIPKVISIDLHLPVCA